MYTAFGHFMKNNIEVKKNKLIGINNLNPIDQIKIYDVTNKNLSTLESLELAGKIHQDVRKIIQPQIVPNMSLNKLAQLIESTTRKLTNNVGINYGIGFPTGLSLNDYAAHYSPSHVNIGTNDLKFKPSDTLKIDFGVEVNGWIVDSAFTVTFDPKHEILLKAMKEATYTGVKNAAVDVDINDWAKDIKEVITSYEVDGKPITPIARLGGHNILHKKIHGGVFLPSVPKSYINNKFKPGVYAIETFGTTGEGKIYSDGNNSLYALKNQDIKINSSKLNKLVKKINKQFSTLPFSSRYLKYPIFKKKYKKSDLDKLVEINVISAYPPLYDSSGGYSAQYEHTIYLDDNLKKVVSKGEDY